jgi:uncharacterized protein YndB with AHSA1/START domain
LAFAGAVRADVVDTNVAGFQVKEVATINAPAAKVWKALANIGAWWSPQHTWSKDSKNLGLLLNATGEMWENLPHDGYVRHMKVIYFIPGKEVVLDGTLGPLMFSGATGHLDWTLAEQGGQTTFTQTYYVGGYYPGGLDKLAPAVDHVLGEQQARLKHYVETGKPE